MVEKIKIMVVVLVLFGLILGIIYGSWWIRRTFNWSFYYGKRFDKIEKRMDDLDRRVTALEFRLKGARGVRR